RISLLAALGAALGVALAQCPSWALSIDPSAARAAESAGVRRVAGRVAVTRSARGPDGVLRTEVTLADGSGRPVAAFTVPGGLEGGTYWAIDGVPAFLTGETVEVGLVDEAGPARL